MRILAIDPGTHCGWAVSDIESGVWDLSIKRNESADVRFVRLRNHLETILPVELIVYEEVQRHLGTYAAHIYGGILAILQTFCVDHHAGFCGCPVGTLKKYATGSGKAGKEEMIRAAARFFPDARIIDDNHADALCLLRWAQEQFRVAVECEG